MKKACLLSHEKTTNIYRQQDFRPTKEVKNYNIKSKYVTTRVSDGFIIYFSKCPSSVFVEIYDIMATKRNKVELKTLHSNST